MEPSSNRQAIIPLNILIALAAILCGLFIFLDIAGYGTLAIDGIPPGATVKLNGHTLSASSLKLRPGDYQILVASPLITPNQSTVHIKLLQTTTFKPDIQPRNVDAIASSAIGAAVGTSQPPHLTQVRWFGNNTWLVGYLPAGNNELALHFDNTKKLWAVTFYNANGYPQDSSILPSDVATYINQLESLYVR